MKNVFLLSLILTSNALATGGSAFRGDGNGFYAGARDIVTSANDWPDKPAANVVWKYTCPQQTYGHSQPVIVKGMLYALREFDQKNPSEYGPSLMCLDAATGKLLWEKCVTWLDQFMEAGKQQEVLAAYARHRTRINAVHEAQREGYKRWNEPGANKKQIEEEVIAAMKPKFDGMWIPLSGTGPSLKYEGGTPARKDMETIYKNRLWFTEWCWPQGVWVGESWPTPVSDGQRLYFRTNRQMLFCYDLDGNRQWVTPFADDCRRLNQFMASPLLVDGKVIVAGSALGTLKGKDDAGKGLVAFEAATGKKLWEAPSTGAWTLQSPVLLNLNGTTAVHYSGMLVRVSDGKVLHNKVSRGSASNNLVWNGDTVIIQNETGDSGFQKRPELVGANMEGLTAVRYTLEGDTAKAEVVWESKNMGQRHASAVLANGLIITGGLGNSRGLLAVDPATGNVVGSNPKYPGVPWGPIAGGGAFIAGDWSGGEFVLVSADKELKELGRYTLVGERPDLKREGKSWPRFGRFWQATPMIMSGNRVFIRSFKGITCIGDPKQEWKE